MLATGTTPRAGGPGLGTPCRTNRRVQNLHRPRMPSSLHWPWSLQRARPWITIFADFVLVYHILVPLKTLKVHKSFHFTILIVFHNFLQDYRDFFLASVTKSILPCVRHYNPLLFWNRSWFETALDYKLQFLSPKIVLNLIVNLRHFYVK